MAKQKDQASISLSFDNLSGPNFSDLTGGIVTSMTGNLFFATPTPSIKTIDDLLTDYNAKAYAARNRDRNAVEAKTIARKLLTANLKSLGRYIIATANGDRQALVSCGFVLIFTGDKIPRNLSPVTGMLLEDGTAPNSIKVSVDGDAAALSYTFQYTLDPVTEESIWKSETVSVREYEFDNLLADKRYWFRVIKTGTKSRREYSGILSRVAQ